MAIAPRPKQKSQLQRGRFPRNAYSHQDPDEPILECSIHRTIVGDNPGAVPSEALQYDLVYIAFCNDKDFWKHWQVVNCARCGKDESISQKNAYIRVVMNLDKEVKLYPTAYTPGFSTVPRTAARDAKKNQGDDNKQIPGLPEGYSVALDVYILEDAKILLDHQRAFRGRVDPKYRWLDEIVNDGRIPEETLGNELAMVEVSPMDDTVVHQDIAHQDRHWTWHSGHLPNSSDLHRVLQPAAADTLPLSCFHACPRGLQKDPRRQFTHVIEKRPDGQRLDISFIIKSLGDFAENHELSADAFSMQGYLDSTPFGEIPNPIPPESSLKFVWTSKQAGYDDDYDGRYKAEYTKTVTWADHQSTGLERIIRAFEKENELNYQRKYFLWCFDAKARPILRNAASSAKETSAWPFTLVWKSEDHMFKVHEERVKQERRRQIHEENALINAFGSHVGLPKRDMGTWGQVEDGSAATRRKELDEETRRLDQALAALQAKTSNHGSALASI